MIRITLYQNTNEANSQSYLKWYPRPVADETYDLDTLARHMASHNSPYSPGVIKGIMTDMVSCIKELLLDGKNVKIDDLAIFSVGLRTNGGSESEKEFSVSKHVAGIRLRARATGELATGKLNLDAVVRRYSLTAGSPTDGNPSDNPSDNPGDDSGNIGGGGIEGI